MKKVMQAFAVVLMLVALSHGAVPCGHYQDVTWNPAGGTIGNVLVKIYPVGTTTLATLYTDRNCTTSVSQTTTPLRSDAVGNFDFYAPPGWYDAQLSVSGYLPYAYPIEVPMPSLGVGHGTTQVGLRPSLYFIDGQGVTFTATDDPTNNRVNISATAAAPASITVAPPLAVPAGQSMAWALPTVASGSGSSSTGYALASGVLHMTRGCGLCDTFSVSWSGFAMPSLPTDAVIQSIYPVQIARRTGVNGDVTAVYEAKCGTTSFSNNWSQYLMSGKFTAGSIGNTVAAVTSASCWSGLQQSGAYTFDDTVFVSFMGLAVYYTTATPYVPASMYLPEPTRPIDGIDAHSLTPLYLSDSANRRTCEIEVGNGAAAVVSGDYAPFKNKSCKIPAASTLVEIAVQSDAGTPSVVIERRRGASTLADLLSGALAGATTATCARGGTSQACVDGATSSGSIVLANVALNGGDVIEVKNGTAAGENRTRITAVYEVN